MLTVHMIQHVLLMTLAPPLILLGAPIMPFFARFAAPIYAVRPFSPTSMGARAVVGARPFSTRGLLAGGRSRIGWMAYSGGIYVGAAIGTVARGRTCMFPRIRFSFLVAVVQPWPSVPRWPRWSMLLYLFLATLPCDILSAFLAFCDRVVYTVYLSTPNHFAVSSLKDQQCAGALMWTCVNSCIC